MKRILASVLMGISAAASAASSPLAPYVGRSRVLVMSAPVASDPEFSRQSEIVAAAAPGMKDRDLVVIRIGDTASDDRGATLDAKAVRENLSIPAGRFVAVLIGKDGGVKMRRETTIEARDLFGTIDAMPMRQDEMRRKGR